MEFALQINWRPVIGDPTWVGWITVMAYGTGAVLAGCAALLHPRVEAGKGRAIWFLITAALTFLCINKQLDLQSLFVEIGRFTAEAQGWYEQRRVVQSFFVMGITAFAGLFVAWFVLQFRAFWATHRLLMVGLVVLITFVLLRAVSFHHFDVFLHTTIFGIRLHRILELAGILLVVLAAAWELLTRRKCADEVASEA